MSFEIPWKLHEWQEVARYLPQNRIPTIPAIVLEDFSKDQKEVIKKCKRTRNWEQCTLDSCGRTGTIQRMKRCSGCSLHPSRVVLYCDTQCQRADWPTHKSECGRGYIYRLEDELVYEARRWGVESLEVMRNCTRRANKRREGLVTASAWLLESVRGKHRNMDLRTTALSIYCRSTNQGKGQLIPICYKLEPIADTPFKDEAIKIRSSYPSATVGIVQLWVDKVYHRPLYVSMNLDRRCTTSTWFWPWIFATLLGRENRDSELARWRLLVLAAAVETLRSKGKEELLQFRAPTTLENGEAWYLYGFDEWQAIFGHVIGF